MTESRSGFRDAMEQMFADFEKTLPPLLPPWSDVTFDQPLEVKKLTAYQNVSCCVLTDATGENHCKHPPYVAPPVPLLRRLRYRLRGWWSGLRMRLGSFIAGADLSEREEEW